MKEHPLHGHDYLSGVRPHSDRNKNMQIIHIMIVDDHPLVRTGFRQLIESESDLIVSYEAANLAEAMQIIQHNKPDLAIVDLSLPDGSGLDLVKRIHARYPGVPVLVSSMHDEDLFAERALRAGARGYINKQEAGDEVIVALRQILAGEVYLSARMSQRLAQENSGKTHDSQQSPVEQLSNRELEVFELIGHGLVTGEIASKLHLSVKTIETHRANIKAKLGLNSAGELTRSAVQWTTETMR